MSTQDRALVPMQPDEGKPYLDSSDILIIGNGIAGLTAALEARSLAPDKRIVVITEQIHPTINTPALKQFATGRLSREELLAYPAGTEWQERIHVVTAHVEEIHARGKYVTLTGSRGFGYESLLLATGSSPNCLPANLPGRHFDGVITLHRLQDYLDLRRRLTEVSEAVVIGGGAHAIETVQGLLTCGVKVHWLIRSATFMPRVLDEHSSEMVLDGMRRAGAIVQTETEVTGIVGRVGCVAGVVTSHREMIPCQLVLACTGTQASTELAQRCSIPLDCKRGILVDDQFRTNVPGIFAAGDVAAIKNPQTGKYETRAQWYAAVSQGRIVGAIMAGNEEPSRTPIGVQWHATHLGELSMLTVGDPMAGGEKITTLTDTSGGGYRRLALLGDRLVGYLSLGSTQPDSLSIKRLVDGGYSLRDIGKDLLKGNFDARRYFSKERSRAAQGMLVSGNLPPLLSQTQEVGPRITDPLSPLSPGTAVPEITRYSTPRATRQLPEETLSTGKIPALPASSRADAIPAMYGEGTQRTQNTGALMPMPGMRTAQTPPIEYVEEEISAFTGNLPGVSQHGIEEVSPFTGNLPSITHAGAEEFSAFAGNLPVMPKMELEEVSPFTGNLPVVPNRVVEAARVPASRPTVRETTKLPAKVARNGSLWTYADEPAAHQQKHRAGEPVPVRSGTRRKGGLWSYATENETGSPSRSPGSAKPEKRR